MRPGTHIIVAAAAQLYAPLIALFAFALLAGWQAGTGVGFLAGLAFAMGLALYALVNGAIAARRTFPAWLCRLTLVAGVGAAIAGAGAPGLPFASRLVEAGAFASTLGACALIIAALFGRAPTLRDAEW